MQNKVCVVTLTEEISPEITGFIKNRYGQDTSVEVVFTARKDVRATLIRERSRGAVFTICGELSRKMVKKVLKSGIQMAEIVIDPSTRKPSYIATPTT